MPVIKTLRTTISDGQQSYPIFLGFLSAEELASVAAVPSFTDKSENYDIANNILGNPVKNWQRPPISWKVDAIKERFSKSAEIMPNPVLLAVNDKSLVEVRQQALNGQHTEIYEIEVQPPPVGGDKPLWILDGQHRVLGLSKSVSKTNPVPLVLLHNDTLNAYAPKQFAKIFAEVTTLATPLHGIHSEWLQFAFHLDKYNSPTTADWRAMKAVADLCRTQEIGQPAVTNPFFNKIAFNPELGGSPAIGKGFEFTCTSLKELVRDHYYGAPIAGLSVLTPENLAGQLGLSVLALAASISTTTTKSAFFGDSKWRQKYMEESFIIGVLTYLRLKGAPKDWTSLLKTLNFTSADWDFTGWVVTTGGNSGTLSKTVASAVYRNVFSQGALPTGVPDIPTFLRGDSASISFKSSALTPKGRAQKHGGVDHVLPVSGVKKLDMESRRHLKVSGISVNIGQLEIRDVRDILSTTFSAPSLRRGIVMPAGGGRVELIIGAALYGGTKPPPLNLQVTWE